MGNRYRRIVTLSMISFTALLAWGYCMLTYRNEMLYVAIISLVLVASLYALALAVVEMKDKKEELMREYIATLMQDSKTSMDYTDYLETLERLMKASYVQQRKVNTYLGQQNEIVTDVMQGHTQAQVESFAKLEEQMDEALTKAVKILVKYTQSEGNKQIEATKELAAGMSEELTELTSAVGKITAVLQQMTMEIGYLKDAVAKMPNATQMQVEMPTVNEQLQMEMVAASAEEEQPQTEMVTVSAEEEQPEMPVVDEEEQSEDVLDVDAILASLEKATEQVEEAEVEETGIDESGIEESQTDFSSEDFFAQFGGTEDASLKEEAAFKEEAMESATNANGMLDQSMIDALLGNLTIPEAKEEPLADVIPFPQADETEPEVKPESNIEATQEETITEEMQTEEAPAVAPLDGDPNRQLSPEEIAALFASMQ